jgi:hypothetical protein
MIFTPNGGYNKFIGGFVMGLLDRIAKYLSSSGSEDENAYWVYVRCNRCGEQLISRVNLYNDLSVEYEGKNDQTYYCRKTIVGRKGCFQRIEVEMMFDKNRKMIDREISGGEFIKEEEYSVIDKTA